MISMLNEHLIGLRLSQAVGYNTRQMLSAFTR